MYIHMIKKELIFIATKMRDVQVFYRFYSSTDDNNRRNVDNEKLFPRSGAFKNDDETSLSINSMNFVLLRNKTPNERTRRHSWF